MSLARLLVEIDHEPARKKLTRLQGKFANFKPVMEGPVRELVRKALIQQFRTRGGYGGKKWAPLKQSTIERKRDLGVLSLGPLKRTRRLYLAATSRDHPDQEVRVGKDGFFFRINLPYGILHQVGSPGGRMPAREVVPDPMPEEFMQELRKSIRGYLVAVEFE